MKSALLNITYEIQLQSGEKLTLPTSIVESVGEGEWIITIQPKSADSVINLDHSAFLNGYALEDEGLYDDYLTPPITKIQPFLLLPALDELNLKYNHLDCDNRLELLVFQQKLASIPVG